VAAEGKYSLRLAAIDAFSATFGDFGKKSKGVEAAIKGQQAELRKLNAQAKDMAGLVKLQDNLKKTEEALQKAREEQARVTREHAQATAKANDLSSAYGKAVAATKALEASTSATKAQVTAARSEQNRLGRELDGVTASLRKLDTQQDKAAAGVGSLERSMRREKDEVARLDSALNKAGVDTTKLASEQARLKTAAESVNTALSAQRARLDAVSNAQKRVDANKAARADLRGQVAETAAVGYLASRPIKQAMELETAMADVGKVINFEGDQRKEMAAANLRMASDRLIASSGMTAVDLAKIEYAAGQSGIGNKEKTAEGKQARVMEFTRDAAIMGSAFDIDAQTAGETMAGWQASMKLNRGQTLDLADSVNYLGNNFNAKAADIASVVKRFGAVGSASGLSPEQTAALSAALLNPGTEKEIAGTGFKNFTSALVAGKSATKGEKKQWKELGFDPEQLAADMQTNAPATILDVLKAIRDQPREEQAAIATNLFGSESIGAIQPLLENLEPLEQAFGMVGDKSKYATSKLGDMGSMMQEAAGVANTSATGWNAFTARLTRLGTVVGNAMLPALNAVLVPLGALVDGFSWAAETFPGVTGTLAVAAAGLVSLKVGALGMKFVGLLLGQAFNRAGLAKAKLDATTAQTANSAAGALGRLNGALDDLGGGGGSGGGAGKKRRPGARARLARRSLRGGLATAKSLAGGAVRLAGRFAAPVAALASGVEVVNGIASGDAKQVGSGLGGAGGALAGASAGGALGAAIGSVVPVVGTAIGGAIGAALGGFFGSDAGSWLGGKVFGMFQGDPKADQKSAEGPPVSAPGALAAAGAAPGANLTDAQREEAIQRGRAKAQVPLDLSSPQLDAPLEGLSAKTNPGDPKTRAEAVAQGTADAKGIEREILGGSAPDQLAGRLTKSALEAPARLGLPAEVKQQVVGAASAAAASAAPAAPSMPPIQIIINGQDQASAKALVDKVMQELQAKMASMFNPLGIRAGAMLTDGVSG